MSHDVVSIFDLGLVDTFKLEGKSHFTVGRLPICDVPFEHPSLSRYHAILQFKSTPSPEKPVGFYLYDLDSTHGTQHNKQKGAQLDTRTERPVLKIKGTMA